jgi:hypothetical protein
MVSIEHMRAGKSIWYIDHQCSTGICCPWEITTYMFVIKVMQNKVTDTCIETEHNDNHYLPDFFETHDACVAECNRRNENG